MTTWDCNQGITDVILLRIRSEGACLRSHSQEVHLAVQQDFVMNSRGQNSAERGEGRWEGVQCRQRPGGGEEWRGGQWPEGVEDIELAGRGFA